MVWGKFHWPHEVGELDIFAVVMCGFLMKLLKCFGIFVKKSENLTGI